MIKSSKSAKQRGRNVSDMRQKLSEMSMKAEKLQAQVDRLMKENADASVALAEDLSGIAYAEGKSTAMSEKMVVMQRELSKHSSKQLLPRLTGVISGTRQQLTWQP